MKKSAPKKSVPKAAEVTLVAQSNESDGLTMARAALSPSLNAAIAAHSYQKNLLGDDVPLMNLADALRLQSKEVHDGDLSGLESMLVGQAVALQSIFTSLVRRAQVQTQQRHLEAFLGLGLKAQAQSRATIQALVELKYPRQAATFVKQANISAGHQQVNNHSAPGAAPRTREIQSEKSKLLVEHDDGSKTMDARAATAASGSHPALEAVESIDRPDQRRRKGEVIAQRRQGRRMAGAARND
jgi:hypothetical protein